MKIRRKTIRAGLLVKVVDSTPPLPRDTAIQRAAKQKATTAARKLLNFKTAQGKLELKLAANFTNSDYFVTLTYAPGKEPGSRKECNADRAQFIRKLREQRKKRGEVLKWICSPEHKHGEARWHLHGVINAANQALDFDEISSLWPHGDVHITKLFDSEHRFNTWLDVARYLTKERPEDGKDETPVGAQIYSCSRNLINPITNRNYYKSEWVQEEQKAEIPETAIIIETEEKHTEFGFYRYIKYMIKPLYERE